ncbi:MAG: hypothetical protein KAS39_07390, partial [Actinomycetia bacterium]|nr:hypothetical protein [Actinomycetes bacterium]
MKNICRITCTGKDVIGLVGLLSSTIAEMNGNIVDIVENVVGGYFSIFILADISMINIPPSRFEDNIRSVAKVSRLDTIIKFEDKLFPKKLDKKVAVALIGKDGPGIVAKISVLLGNYGINITHVRMIARGELFIMELTADSGAVGEDISVISNEVRTEMLKINVTPIFQTDNIYSRKKRLISFQMAFPFINADLFKDHNDTEPGTASFSTLFKEFKDKIEKLQEEERIEYLASLLKGVSTGYLAGMASSINVSGSIREVMDVLKNMGYIIAFVSPGFDIFIRSIKESLSIDYSRGNILQTERGIFTGFIKGDIMDKERRETFLKKTAASEFLDSGDIVHLNLSAETLQRCFSFENEASFKEDIASGKITEEQLLALYFT